MQKKKTLCIILILISVNTLFSQFGDSIPILDSMRLYNFFNEDTTRNVFSNYSSDDHGNTVLDHTLSYQQRRSPQDWETRLLILYDPYGYQSNRVFELWDEEKSDWIFYTKWIYTHDHLGRERSEASYTWDKGSEMWIGQEKDSTGYDLYGNIDYEQEFQWNYFNKNWNGSHWKKTTWNEKGQVVQTLSSNGIGQVENQEAYFYTKDGLDSLHMTYKWDNTGTTWILKDSTRIEYTFDSSARAEEIWRFSWSEEEAKWLTTSKTVFSYAEQGDTITEVTHLYLLKSETWKHSESTTSVRDSLNRIVFYKHYINPGRSPEYEECIWYINTFNDASQLASIEEQYWSPLFMDWKSAKRTEYTYSKEGELVEEFWYGLSPPELPDWTLIGFQKNYYSMLGDILAPRLSVQTDTVELGNDILFTSSQDAQISLVPSGTFPGPVFSQSVIEYSDVTGMVKSSIQTSKITEPGQYLLYASNSDEIFSYASRIWITTNTTSLERYQYLEYKIYPSITEGIVTLESSVPFKDVSIYNLSGGLEKRIDSEQPTLSIDLSELPIGMYLIKPRNMKGELIFRN